MADTNELLKEKLVEYLGSMEKGLQTATDFTIEQAPLVVQEFIMWEVARGSLFALAGLLFVLSLVVGTMKCWKWIKENEAEPAIMIPMVVSVFGFCMMYEGAMTAGKAYVAPRVVALEKAASLLR